MEDPLIQVESLDSGVIDYIDAAGKTFQDAFGELSVKARAEVDEIYRKKRLLSARITTRGILQSYTENGLYHVSLEGNLIHTTPNVVFWIESDPEGKRIGVFETGGSDSGLLTMFKDGEVSEKLEGTISGITFTEDSYYLVKTFVDEKTPDGGPPNSHRVLKDGDVVFGKGMGPEDFITLYRSGKMIYAVVGDWTRSDIYAGSLEDPSSWKRVKGENYEITPLGFRDGRSYYLESRGNGVVTRDGEAVIEGVSPINSALLVSDGILVIHMDNARARPVLYDMEGNVIVEFPMDTPMGLKSYDSDGEAAVLALESFGIPFSLFKFHGRRMQKIDESRIMDADVRDGYADSDGTRIHYFLVNSGSARSNGALAYGYGGFNIPVSPMFYPMFAYLMSKGITIAVSNLRGGNEYGEEWHRAGMLHNKQNVFNDFQAVIRTLRGGGMKVVAFGVSNGGLLVGTTLTQAPEILDGAVIGNPVLDMMRFHRMSVGKYWVSEFGDPDSPGDRDYLLKYSPYHNIRDVEYPDTLIYSRLKDDRVHPAHAIKFHMALRDKGARAYLRVNKEGGHIGIAADETINEISDVCAFVMHCLQ